MRILSAYKKTPDAIIMNQSGMAKVVGELKVPWVQSHCIMDMLTNLTEGYDDHFRIAIGKIHDLILRVQYVDRIVGQIALYMRDLGLKYGFFTTYNETVFLLQVNCGRI
jgi:hypothetical protein